MNDARWFEIDLAVAAAVRHFTGAKELFNRLPGIAHEIDLYGVEKGFMHAMQPGQMSLEAAQLRILDLCGEAAPTSSRWHADLIAPGGPFRRQAASHSGCGRGPRAGPSRLTPAITYP